MEIASVFIIGGDEERPEDIRQLLLPQGFNIIETQDSDQVLPIFDMHKPDLVLIRASLKDSQAALQQVKKIRGKNNRVPILFITRCSSEALAIAALKAGVSDYLKEPYTPQTLLESVTRHLAQSHSLRPTASEDKSRCICGQPMIGQSKPMREVKAYLRKVAATDSTVMITGETGTGKELAARMVHYQSRRCDHPLICINCAALPESLVESELFGFERGAFTGAVAARQGKFVLADGGSLFLDEIGDMNQYAQAKILRSLECNEVFPLGGNRALPINVRVIAATNHNPEQLMAGGRFREDLYYRLNVARVHLPPLRERKEDIPNLMAHGIISLNHRFNRQVLGLTERAMAMLLRHEWPGNVRELLNLLEATFINLPHEKIDYADLPLSFRQRYETSANLPPEERRQIVSALLETKWNKSQTAQKLNWSRMTVYRKIAKYHIVENRIPPR